MEVPLYMSHTCMYMYMYDMHAGVVSGEHRPASVGQCGEVQPQGAAGANEEAGPGGRYRGR